MPRKLDARMTLDDLEDEILFTSAGLEVDPDAEDLAPATQGWLPLLDRVRAQDREVRWGAARVDASRAVNNGRLDHAVVAFGDDLFPAVGKDRSSARWRTFFTVPVSQFVKWALGREVAAVKGWLASSKDPVLEKHREPLAKWSTGAGDAVVATRALGPRRGEVWQAREELAEALTRERDGLHAELTKLGQDRKLPRDWPDTFFRVERRHAAPEPPAPATPTE
ncbi:MAG: hypothetical protein HY720_11845 [Planctomycetes bacterium]|nr:hypothetical protein [Planctomycetota bacterium]